MISSWRKKRAARRAVKARVEEGENGEMEIAIPHHFRCSISLDLMKDPVTLATGITYDRENIEKWIEAGNVTCPITNQVLDSFEPIPNHSIRKMIQAWCVENKSHGIERIPTPRIPVRTVEVLEMKSKITTAYKGGDDPVGCQTLVSKIKSLIKESERNKRCIMSNGMGSVLAAAFEEFSKTNFNVNSAVLEEILSCLTLMFPLDGETRRCLGSVEAMDCLVWFLKGGDLSRRRNAALILREIVSADQSKVEILSTTEGAMEELFKLIKQPICPTATKAAIQTVYHMVTSPSPTNPVTTKKLVDMGLVPLLLETVVDTERSICERALGVLDGIFEYDQGRQEAYNHALTIPLLVKKIHRVSDLATEFSVSILWKLCKRSAAKTPTGDEHGSGNNDNHVIVEAIQVGAFQKLLLLLQVGCGERTKEKATELLKLLNLYRGRLECVDSMDFKDLKRPF